MVLVIEVLDGLLTAVAVMVVVRVFRNAETVSGDEERFQGV